MTEGNKHYRQYERLIKSQARQYSAKYHVPIEDVESQANEIYCKSLLSFDPEMGTQFSTHLYNNLKSLNYYCRTLQSEWDRLDVLDELLQAPPKIDGMVLRESISELSPVSQELVISLIAGEKAVSAKQKRKITVNYIRKELSCGLHRVEIIFDEISRWWNGIECYI